jgi:putative DNA primase/helicase
MNIINVSRPDNQAESKFEQPHEARDARKALPPLTPSVMPFNLELLPDILRPWAQDVADRMSCPVDFTAVAALCTMGADIGNTVCIQLKVNDSTFKLPCNLWGGIIGAPSTKKTPALSEMLRPLKQIEKKLKESNDELLKDYETEMQKHALKLECKKKEARKDGAYSYEPPAAPDAPRLQRIMVNTVTGEKLHEICRDNPNGILLFRDELAGWMQELEKAGRESDRPFFLEGFNGNADFTSDRIGRGTQAAETVCLSILGAIQPGQFEQLLRAEGQSRKADGLLQRFSLLVWPRSANFKYIDRSHDEPAEEAYSALIKRFYELREKGSYTLRFDAEAQRAYVEWISTLMNRLSRPGKMPESMVAHLAKYQKTIPAIALLCELADNPTAQAVSLRAWERAERWAEYLESHAQRIYAPMVSPEIAAAHAIVRRLDDLPETFTSKQVYSKDWQHLTDSETVNSALEIMVECYWLTSATRTTPKGGRPSITFTKTDPMCSSRN